MILQGCGVFSLNLWKLLLQRSENSFLVLKDKSNMYKKNSSFDKNFSHVFFPECFFISLICHLKSFE